MSEYAGKNGRAYDKLKVRPEHKILIDGSSSTFAFYWSAGLRTHQAFQRVRTAPRTCAEIWQTAPAVKAQ